MNFLELYNQTIAILFPQGQPENLIDSHKLFLQTALWDLQRNVECFRFANRNVYPHCATYFDCGMTVIPAPRGEITRLLVYGKDASGNPDECTKLEYLQVDFKHIERYVQLHRGCGTNSILFSSALTLGIFGCGWRDKYRYPCPTDEGLETLPSLPQGFHYPQTSTDLGGRARAGVWAINRGRIYIAPWIESSETVVVEWNGIKNQWGDADLVEDDKKFLQAVRLNVNVQHYTEYEHNTEKLLLLETQWREALKDLINDCRNSNRVREDLEVGGNGSGARGLGTSDTASAAFYNEQQSFTANCPTGQVGTPVTATVAAGEIGSSLSVADANAKALAQAQADATSRLSCEAAPTVYLNTPQTFTAQCAGASGDTPAAVGAQVTVTTPAGQYQSSVSQSAADAAALAAATSKANSQLACTFYNAPRSYTASCPTDTTGADVTINIPAAEFNSVISQEDANQLAEAAAQSQATDGLACVGLPTYTIGNTEQKFPQIVNLYCLIGNPIPPAHSGPVTVYGICPADTFTALVTSATEVAARAQLNQQALTRARALSSSVAAVAFQQFQHNCRSTPIGGGGI